MHDESLRYHADVRSETGRQAATVAVPEPSGWAYGAGPAEGTYLPLASYRRLLVRLRVNTIYIW